SRVDTDKCPGNRARQNATVPAPKRGIRPDVGAKTHLAAFPLATPVLLDTVRSLNRITGRDRMATAKDPGPHIADPFAYNGARWAARPAHPAAGVRVRARETAVSLFFRLWEADLTENKLLRPQLVKRLTAEIPPIPQQERNMPAEKH